MTRADHQSSFEEYVAARYGALLRSAYLMVGNRPDAEDLLQTTLVKCVPKWSSISADPEPYVRTVLARESITRWRRRRWREVSSDDLPEPGLGGVDSAAVLDLRAALQELPPRQRTAVVLRHYLELSERETADAMGCSVGAVKSQTHAAMTRLRALLGEQVSVQSW